MEMSGQIALQKEEKHLKKEIKNFLKKVKKRCWQSGKEVVL